MTISQRESQDKRGELLERAMELFAARGYDAVGVQEIAEAAGVTKPTLYYYFGNKEGLLRALLEGRYQALEAGIRAALDYRHDLSATLRNVASTFLRFAQDYPVYYRLYLSLWFAPAESHPFTIVSGLNARLQHMMEGLFLRAVHDHGNMRNRHRAYASSFLGMINTYSALALNGDFQPDREGVRRIVHQFEHGIYS
jgi:TetR/AcrR family transcriptional regulator